MILDGALTVAMTDGLEGRLQDIRDIQVSTQATIGSTAQALVYTNQDVAALTSVVDTKASQVDLTDGLLTRATVSSLVAGLSTKQSSLDFASSVTVGTLQSGAVTVSGATRLEGDVDILGTTNANIVTASTLTATNVTASAGRFGFFSHRL